MEQVRDETTVKKHVGKRPLVIVVAVCCILVAAYLVLCGVAAGSSTIFRGVSFRDLSLGGMDVQEATEALSALSEDQWGTCEGQLVGAEGQTPSSDEAGWGFYLSDLGFTLDAPATAQRAYDLCHSGGFFSSGYVYLRCLLGGMETDAVFSYDDQALDQAATKIEERMSREPMDTSYTMKEDALVITLAQDGRTVSHQDVYDALERAAEAGDFRNLEVPYTTLPAKSLTAQEIYDTVSGEMQNARYDADQDVIIPEQAGAEFDVAQAQALLDAAQPGETVEVPAEVTLPTITAEELEAVLFRDVLGECTTHVGGTSARISNVKLASAAVNGTILNAGEVFSYNATTGQRTAAKGYLPAPAYVQGETVDEIGGGVCQPSSTLYYACLLANLEITERYAHRYIPSYITRGMDATVSWGGPDYKFTNNTDYPIKIVATYSGGYLTMQILGTKTDDVTVKMTYETISTTPYQVIEEEDASLAPGTQKVKTTPYTGYKVKTYRNLYDGDGNLISSTYEATSDYKSRNKVILVGPEEEPDTPTSGETPLPGETDPPGGGTTQPENPSGGETTQPENPSGGETTQPETPSGGETGQTPSDILPEDLPFL